MWLTVFNVGHEANFEDFTTLNNFLRRALCFIGLARWIGLLTLNIGVYKQVRLRMTTLNSEMSVALKKKKTIECLYFYMHLRNTKWYDAGWMLDISRTSGLAVVHSSLHIGTRKVLLVRWCWWVFPGFCHRLSGNPQGGTTLFYCHGYRRLT